MCVMVILKAEAEAAWSSSLYAVFSQVARRVNVPCGSPPVVT